MLVLAPFWPIGGGCYDFLQLVSLVHPEEVQNQHKGQESSNEAQNIVDF
ncbi:hypothetical protein M5D96_011206, partial [Drosophila gunungcola]